MSSFGDELKDDVRREAKTWLRWTIGGAVVGAVLVGGVALYVFGMSALLYGALIGAAIGGVASLLFYLNASTFTG